MTREQQYKKQMQELGIYEEVFDPEIKTLARIERELTRAMKAWSDTAPPGGKPSFLDDHYPVIQKLRAEALQHRESLGLTPKALRKLTGAAGTDAPQQKDLITAKLDQIAARVSGYDGNARVSDGSDGWLTLRELAAKQGGQLPETAVLRQTPLGEPCPAEYVIGDPFAGIPAAEEAAAISDLMDEELRAAVHEDMG